MNDNIQRSLKLAIYAENVPTYELDDDEVLELFGRSGELAEMKILENCVFAQYQSESEALESKVRLGSQKIKGSILKVNLIDLNEYERLSAKCCKRKHNTIDRPIDCYLIMADKKRLIKHWEKSTENWSQHNH